MDKKILILGHGRSGKDTAAEYWHGVFGLKHESSSMAAARIFIYDALKEKYGYENFNQCYNDRHKDDDMRKEWFDLITEFNREDPSRLAKEILKDSDCYVGMRDTKEIQCCQYQFMFDLIIWIDAKGRVKDESPGSFNITKDIADIVIENKGDVLSFVAKLDRIGEIILRG